MRSFPKATQHLKIHRFRQFSASIVFCRLELSSTEFLGVVFGFRHRQLNEPLVASGSKISTSSISCDPFHHHQNPGRSHAVAPWYYHRKTAFSKWIPRAFRCAPAISCATCALWRKCVKKGLKEGLWFLLFLKGLNLVVVWGAEGKVDECSYTYTNVYFV